MAFTVVIVHNVQDRYHGFLQSMMLEINCGVYISTNLNKSARERLWNTLIEWHGALKQGQITIIWQDRTASGGIRMNSIGENSRELYLIDNIYLTRKR